MESQKLVKLLALAGGAFVAYRYVYLPWKFQQLINQQAAAAGMDPNAYIAKLGAAGCQALAMYYHIPPSASGGACGVVGSAVESAPSWLSSIGHSAATSTAEAGQALGVALPALGSGAGGLVSGVAGGVAGGMKSLTDASIYGVRQTAGLVKDGAVSVAAGLKYVSVEPVKLVASGVESGAKAVASGTVSVLKHLNPFSW